MATSAAPIQLAVYGDDLDVLHRLARGVLDIAEANPDIYMPFTSSAMTQPEYRLNIDRRRAQELGLTVQMVSQQAYYALNGGMTRRYYNRPNVRQNSILVRYDEADRGTMQDLSSTYITTKEGQQVPLSTVATMEPQRGPTLIEHVNGKRVVYVNGYYRKNGPASMDLSMAIAMQAGAELDFPPGYGIDSMGDMTDMMIEFSRLLKGLISVSSTALHHLGDPVWLLCAAAGDDAFCAATAWWVYLAHCCCLIILCLPYQFWGL